MEKLDQYLLQELTLCIGIHGRLGIEFRFLEKLDQYLLRN